MVPTPALISAQSVCLQWTSGTALQAQLRCAMPVRTISMTAMLSYLGVRCYAGPIPIAWKLMTSEPRSFRVTGPTGPPMGHLEPAGHASIQLDYLPVPMSVPTQPCTGKFLLQAVAYKGKEPAVLDHAVLLCASGALLADSSGAVV